MAYRWLTYRDKVTEGRNSIGIINEALRIVDRLEDDNNNFANVTNRFAVEIMREFTDS